MQKFTAIQERMADGKSELTVAAENIGEEGAQSAQALKDNLSLTTLVLWKTQTGAAGAKELAQALKHNNTLTVLDLSSNQIGVAGAKELAQALKGNHTLTELDLYDNQISDAGAKELAHALKDNHGLTRLKLGNNQIGNAGAKELAQALKDNHTLTLLYLRCNHIGADPESKIKILVNRNQAYRAQHYTALEHLAVAAKLLASPDIDAAMMLSLNQGLDAADGMIESLKAAGYKRAFNLAYEVNGVRALAYLQTGNLVACLEIYTHQLQPQPPETLSFRLASHIYAELDKLPFQYRNDNLTLILMLLRGTNRGESLQFNILRELRNIKEFTASKPLTAELGVDKIVSVLDKPVPNKNQQTETCILYEELALAPHRPTVYKVFAGEIPESGNLDERFEAKKKELLDHFKCSYQEYHHADMPPSSSSPSW